MNPQISIPTRYGGPSQFGSTTPTASGSGGLRIPGFFKRLFKFAQMDFEMAIWEMTSLLIAPKKVFKSIYYHVRKPPTPAPSSCSNLFHHRNVLQPIDCAFVTPVANLCATPETKNTWHRPDPSFTYLLSFFLLLTAFAWGLAYAPAFSSIVKLSLIFIFVHFLTGSVLISTIAYFVVGRLLGPGIAGLPGRRRQQGLFTSADDRDQLEFGYCFDVSIRAFFPVWVFIYVLQFILMPLIARSNWISTFLGNTLYLAALSYWTIITFLGYNALPFLHHTELLLSPMVFFVALWFISLFGFNMPETFAPILLAGVRKLGS